MFIDLLGEDKKNIKDPKKCQPKDISNARLKDQWEKRKSKKLKPTEKNAPTIIQFTTGDTVTQSLFV
ncbi:hypothetical protein IEQ34_012543 [Dendrobium chrysotoxum]|uniref:Uncharacterized protein n=1 Tax=Dendrobium chrysotoxum TaxID=161865 RepID=A0AAV7GVC9_DENCH|nr:hypothetical protein IEQ34_012543 [Dendrobium chrysotoxum]